MVIYLKHVALRLWWALIPHRFVPYNQFASDVCDRCHRSREGWH